MKNKARKSVFLLWKTFDIIVLVDVIYMYVNINGDATNVIVKRKAIKNVYFKWSKDDLIVTCNNYLSTNSIEKMIKKNADSLLKLKKRTPVSDLKTNEMYYLGEKYVIEYDGVSKTYLDGNKIISKDVGELNKFWAYQCQVVFNSRLERLKPQFDDLPQFKLKIRKMSTRWGVCNKNSMSVTLNSELLKKDVSLIDYVIIHELCHFKYMNHSSQFWAEVEKYYPYHKMARKMLRESQND